MLLKNANDGTAAYDLMAALFRATCLNDRMVAHISTLSSCKVRHSGDVSSKVIEGTFSVIEQGRFRRSTTRQIKGVDKMGRFSTFSLKEMIASRWQ